MPGFDFALMYWSGTKNLMPDAAPQPIIAPTPSNSGSPTLGSGAGHLRCTHLGYRPRRRSAREPLCPLGRTAPGSLKGPYIPVLSTSRGLLNAGVPVQAFLVAQYRERCLRLKDVAACPVCTRNKEPHTHASGLFSPLAHTLPPLVPHLIRFHILSHQISYHIRF